MSFDARPLSPSTIIIRPDLTLAVVVGETVIEVHMSPEEALEISEALESYAIAQLVATQIEKPHDDKRPVDASAGSTLT